MALPEWLSVRSVVAAGVLGVVFSTVWEECVRARARRRKAAAGGGQRGRDGRVPNPFMNLSPVNYYSWRYIWPGVVLIPIRVGLFVGGLLFTSAVGFLVGNVFPPKEGFKKQPLSGWRKRLMLFGSQWGARMLLHGLGIHHIDIVGHREHAGAAPIVVANHRGPIEAFYFIAFHDVCCVSAIENRFPIIRYALDSMQTIFVDRQNPDARKIVSETIKSRATAGKTANGCHWPQVFLFPEGTTTNGQALIKFKAGAFNPGVPVQPVAVEFPNTEIDTDPSYILGIRGPMFGLPKIFLRLMASWHNPMRVTYLPVVRPTAEMKANPPIFAQTVREVIAHALDVPMTDHEIEDMVLCMTAAREGMSPSEGAVEFGKIKDLCRMSGSEAKDLLKRFKELDVDGDGELSIAEVAAILDLPPDGAILRGLFRALSQREDGTHATINFREFLTGIAKASSGMTPEEKAEFIFAAFDLNESGDLSEDELFCMMKLGFESITHAQVAAMRKQITQNASVTKEQFINFLVQPENKAYLFLFDLLRKAREDEPSLVPKKRHDSFIKHQEDFLN